MNTGPVRSTGLIRVTLPSGVVAGAEWEYVDGYRLIRTAPLLFPWRGRQPKHLAHWVFSQGGTVQTLSDLDKPAWCNIDRDQFLQQHGSADP